MFGRVLNYFLNEFIVNALANSRSFQRIALRIDGFLTKQTGQIKNVGDDVKKVSEVKVDEINKKAAEQLGFDFKAFFNTIKEEVSKDVKNASVGTAARPGMKK